MFDQFPAQRMCPDDGTCHHGCILDHCWRVEHCAPLSVYGEKWTDGLMRLYREREMAMQDADRRSCQGGWRLAQERAVRVVELEIALMRIRTAAAGGHHAGSFDLQADVLEIVNSVLAGNHKEES